MGENEFYQYVHMPEDEDIGFDERPYRVVEEGKLEYKGRKVLYFIVESTNFTCCDQILTSQLATVRVVGYIIRWKYRTNEKGEAISEIEPIRDNEARQEITKILRKKHMVNVNFLGKDG